MADDVDAWLDSAQPAETAVPVCLRLDLVADYEALSRQLAAPSPADEGLAGARDVDPELVERLADLKAQMQAATRLVRLRAMEGRSWDELMAAHPPNPDNADHVKAGYNPDTFYAAALRQSIVDPVMSASRLDKLISKLTSPQRQELYAALNKLNVYGVSVPL